MGEMWMGTWFFAFAGLFTIAAAIYVCFDLKRRGQKTKLWKPLLAIAIGLVLMFPILSGAVLWLLRLPL